MPPGAGDWLAYAFVNNPYSFYNNRWCSYVSAHLHDAAARIRPIQGPRRILLQQELTFGLLLEEIDYGPTPDHLNGYSEERWVAVLPDETRDVLHTPTRFMELIDIDHRIDNVAGGDDGDHHSLASESNNSSSKIVSGLSTLTLSESIADLDTGSIFVPRTAKVRVDSHPIGGDDEDSTDGRMRRRRHRHLRGQRRQQMRQRSLWNNNGGGSAAIGEYKTIVIRITDSRGKGPQVSARELIDAVYDGEVSMKSQYAACSYNKLRIQPTGGNDGVYELTLPNFRIEDGVTQRLQLQAAAIEEAEKQLGDIENEYDLV